jgi:hypothetical protein
MNCLNEGVEVACDSVVSYLDNAISRSYRTPARTGRRERVDVCSI